MSAGRPVPLTGDLLTFLVSELKRTEPNLHRRGYLHTLRDRRCQGLRARDRSRIPSTHARRAWPSSEFVSNIAAVIPADLGRPLRRFG